MADTRTWLRCTHCGARMRLTLVPLDRTELRGLIQTHRCPPGTSRDAFRAEEERYALGYRETPPQPFEWVTEEEDG